MYISFGVDRVAEHFGGAYLAYIVQSFLYLPKLCNEKAYLSVCMQSEVLILHCCCWLYNWILTFVACLKGTHLKFSNAGNDYIIMVQVSICFNFPIGVLFRLHMVLKSQCFNTRIRFVQQQMANNITSFHFIQPGRDGKAYKSKRQGYNPDNLILQGKPSHRCLTHRFFKPLLLNMVRRPSALVNCSKTYFIEDQAVQEEKNSALKSWCVSAPTGLTHMSAGFYSPVPLDLQ